MTYVFGNVLSSSADNPRILQDRCLDSWMAQDGLTDRYYSLALDWLC